MSNPEMRSLLAEYANKTGIEMNNYLVRQLITMRNNGIFHHVIAKLEKYIQECSVNVVRDEVCSFIQDYEFDVDDGLLITIIRENKNRFLRDGAKDLKFTSFVGNCVNHSFTQFSIRGGHYFCAECFETKSNNILYYPIRNLILKRFIDKYGLSINTVAQEVKINSAYMYKYYNHISPIPTDKWEVIATLIKGIKANEEKSNQG